MALFVFTYRPPCNYNELAFIEELTNSLSVAANSFGKIVLVDDLNINA